MRLVYCLLTTDYCLLRIVSFHPARLWGARCLATNCRFATGPRVRLTKTRAAVARSRVPRAGRMASTVRSKNRGVQLSGSRSAGSRSAGFQTAGFRSARRDSVPTAGRRRADAPSTSRARDWRATVGLRAAQTSRSSAPAARRAAPRARGLGLANSRPRVAVPTAATPRAEVRDRWTMPAARRVACPPTGSACSNPATCSAVRRGEPCRSSFRRRAGRW